MAGVVHDIRVAIRLLVRDRWMSLAAVTALALGLAANNTVFTIVNGLLLRDLPFEDPDRIVTIGMAPAGSPRPNAGVSLPDLVDWRIETKAFDGFGAATESTMNVADEHGAPQRLIGAHISAGAFRLLGRAPLFGRDFTAEDDRVGADPVVILGYGVWQDRYLADPGVIGRTVRVSGVPSTVIGVMPEGFGFPVRSRLWQPLAMLPASAFSDRGRRTLEGFGRVAQGYTLDQARADLTAAAATLASHHPATNSGVEPRIAPFRERSIGGRIRAILPSLFAMLLFVLLIACANAANLLLARAVRRSSEIRVRQAIGASRGQIVRQLLVESVLLASIAGVAGLALSLAGVRLFSNAVMSVEEGLPYWIQFGMDWRVFTFLALLCLATGIAFGLVPAVHVTRMSVHSATTVVASGHRWMSRLVVLQLVLTPVLLTGAGLMVRSIEAQQHIDAGVQTSGLVRARLDLSGPKYAESATRARFYQTLEDRLAALDNLPASLVSNAPFEGGAARRLLIAGAPVMPVGERPLVRTVTIGRGYFPTLGTRVNRGADFDAVNSRSNDFPVIVNERFVEQHLAKQDPIGRRIQLSAPIGRNEQAESFVIVGVAPNIRQRSTEDSGAFDPIVYLSYAVNPVSVASILVRSDSAAGAVASLLSAQVREIDPDLPLFGVMTLDESLAQSDERRGLLVFGTICAIVGAIALVLATLGVYGVTAYTTAQRTREIGIRVALGAQAAQIRHLVAHGAFRQLRRGLSMGMIGALGLGQLLRGVLIGTSGLDPVTLLGVGILLVVVTFVAALLPAQRAARLNPVAALRYE